ncbi:hypothetical protein GKC29_24995 [Micromonospora sp. WMMC415]|uniref:ricin-type beta-trefoil lectin domain protein n=1 Tax=Micromonospora sp. WMMC415 TaxID=2675222 RepID=UPI0012B47F59|nr:LamG-like jellyroll fold domain-containing protein [Micromonospora sp. WMMC415]QGN49764.1 hypothetical protein GKC29_24995 [Micromonospora sp. WMMC415]
MGLSLGVPPEVIPAEGGWPLSGLLSTLRQAPALAVVTGLPVQKGAGGAADVDHYVSIAETTADGGAGKAPDRGKGVVDPALPTNPASKAFKTPKKPGDETSFNEKTSKRLPERSTATYDEFLNEDGSITRQIHEGRINYRAADGTYHPIDTTLTKRGDRIDAGANSIDVALAATGSAGPGAASLARVASVDEALASVTTPAGQTFAHDLAGAADVPAVVEESKATYRDILPGADLEMQATKNGLKETIVIDSPAAGHEWLFPLKLEGLTAKEKADGSLDLLGDDGKVALWVPAGHMQDSKVDPKSGAPAQSAGVDYQLLTIEGAPALKVTADAAWLNDPARLYPVRIDQSVSYPESTGVSRDAFVDNDASTTDPYFGDNLPVGTFNGGATKARSFLHFDNLAGDGIMGTQIRSAMLVAHHTWSYNCTSHLPIYVHRVLQAWDRNTIGAGELSDAPDYTTPIGSWTITDNSPACGNTAGDRSVGAWRAVSLPVKTFNGWTSGTVGNFGLALTASETDSVGWKRFTSRDFGDGGYAPYLSLTYDYNVDPQVNEQYPAYGASAATLRPELVADAVDPDNWPKSMRYRFVVYAKDAKTQIATSSWITRKSWTVPAGTLVWGENYYWTVEVEDGLASNAKYLVKQLLTTPVPQPPVTSGLSQNTGQGFDPVIGNYTSTTRDATVTTVGPPLEIARSYNSIDPRTDQAFGVGWSSVLDAQAVEKTATVGSTTAVNTVTVTYPDGRETAFGRNADNTFSSPAGRSATLSKLDAGGYRLIEKSGITYEFGRTLADGTFGISTIKDSAGLAHTFTYTSANLVSRILAASGRTLNFQWTATSPPRVASVTTNAAVAGDASTANTWNYTYTAGALTAVCPPTSATACHTYDYATSRSVYPTAVANVRPYSYWRLNEPVGRNTAQSSVLENGGTDGGTYTDVTLGQPGPLAGSTATAAGFNGTTSQVQLPLKLAGDATTQAISMWFKTSLADGAGVLYGQSMEDVTSTATSTYRAYNPTLYIDSNGKLRGGFPKAPQKGTLIGPLQSSGNGQCLTVSSTNGAAVTLTNCTGGANQNFTWTLDGMLKVTTGGVTRCLDTEDHGFTNGSDLVGGGCDITQGNQTWDVQVDGQIVNVNSGLCLESEGMASGAPMHIWTCSNNRPLYQLFPYGKHDPMVSENKVVADGQWHHVVLSASGNRQELFVDGERVDSENDVTVQDMSPKSSYLGKGFLGGGWPNQPHYDDVSNQGRIERFTGSIAEVAYFDSAVERPVVETLKNANASVKPMTKASRPSGGTAAAIVYDGDTGRVTQLTDGNGGVWKPRAPVLTGSTKVYESAVLGGAPSNYWRLADPAGHQQATNEVNGGDATFNSVDLNVVDGPFGKEHGSAALFDGASSFVALPSEMTPAATSSVSMWFNTSASRSVLLGPSPNTPSPVGQYDVPTMWITSDGKLRALSPSTTPTGPINAVSAAGKCVDLTSGTTTNGTDIQSYTCNGTAAQNWSLVPTDTTNSTFTIQAFGKCMVPQSEGTANGTPVEIWDCVPSKAAHKWRADGGTLRNVGSSRCLYLPGSSTVNGTNLQLYDCNQLTGLGWRPSLASKTAVNDGKWHHAVLTTDGTTQTLYVDGAVAQSSTGPTKLTPGTSRYSLGSAKTGSVVGGNFWGVDGGTNYFSGSLAEVAFYQSVIDESQASYQFKARNAVKSAPTGEIEYRVQGPDDSVTATTNDLMYGRKVSDVNALGNTTRYGYSGKGQLRTVTDPNGNMTINEHDARGNVVAVTTCQDRSANLCSTAYSSYYPNATDANPPPNSLNDRLMEVRGQGSTSATDNTYLTTYTYDANGNRTSETDALGRRTTITYTDGTTAGPAGGGYGSATPPASLPWKVTKPDGSLQRILYYANGDIAEQTDPAGAITRYEYDGLGRTTKEIEVVNGNAGPTTTYTYDRLDRVVTVADPPVTNAVTSAKHSPVTTLVYNVDGSLTSETAADTTGGDASRTISYGYDTFGRRTSQTDATNKTTTFGYDAYGRMTKEVNADGSTVETTFDAVGNELKTVVKNWTPPEGGAARDLTMRSLSYDPAGRLASETDAMGWVTEYTYTDNNLPRTVVRKDPSTGASYVMEDNTYNAAGQKVGQITNNGRSKSTGTYDAAGRTLTATAEVTDTNGTTKRITSYEYSVEDDVVSTKLSDGTTTLGRSDTAYDRLGRARQQTTFLADGLTPTTRWKLDQTGGTTTADAAGNNTGTVDGTVAWSTDRGGSASFTGSTAGSIVGQAPVDTTRAFTVAAWAKLTDTSADRHVLVMGGDLNNSALKLYYDKAANSWRLTMAVRRADGTVGFQASTFTTRSATSAWQHLAVVATPATTPGGASTATLYVDGVVKGSLSTTEHFNNQATDLRVGAQTTGSGLFAGLIDDVQSYQQALTSAEVGQLLAGTAPAATAQVSRTTYGLDTSGSVTSVTGPNGQTSYILNDEAGRGVVTTSPPVSTVLGEGAPVTAVAESRIGFNTFGEVTEQQDSYGNVTINRYDALGRVVEQESPAYTTPEPSAATLTAKTTVEYDEVGQIRFSTDPLGERTEYKYDLLGRNTEIVAPDQGVTTYEYDLLGNLLSHTDPNGAKASSTFDYLGRTLTSTSAVRQAGTAYTTEYKYDNGSPWPTSIVSPAKVVTRSEYNSVGEPTRITDGAGQVTRMTYDGAGRVIRTTAPDGTYSTAAYDFAGRQFSASDYSAAGVLLRNESQRFDVSGNLVASTDARKATKTFAYDTLGQLVTQRESVGPSQTITTEYGYDLNGRQTRFTDGRGNKFVTTYNAWGLPESQIEPATTSNTTDRTFTMTYDKGGRLTRVDSPGGVTVTSEYDAMGRLLKSSGTGAQATTTDKTFTYDKAGRMQSFAGSAGTNQIAYDDRGLVTSISGVSGNSSYTYNGDGALTSRTDAAGTTSYSYDTAGRPLKVENATAGVNMTYSYDAMSRVEKITYPGTVRTLGYNDLRQLTSDTLKNASGTTIAKIDYEWNLNDSLTKKTTTGFTGASTNTYEYDLANRLTLWDNGTTPVVYAYDKSGNRIQAGTTTFTYDQRNQLVSDSSGTTYQYTPRGTLQSTTSGGQTVVTQTDAFNQVKVQGTKTGGSTSYSYDGLGRMLQAGMSYTGLGNDVAADGSAVYVRDVADSLVAVASGSTRRYAWTDAHTDVVGEFTDTGTALTGSVSYDPWGKVLTATGMVGKLGFQQEWTDQTTGKVNMWSRWYDPQTGAFDTRDTADNNPTPTSGSANRFAYAEGDPLSNTDTTGNAVDGKCGEYDYACALRRYQAAMDVYNDAMEQRDRDMQAAGAQIAQQEAEFQRAEREGQVSLLDILLQVGVGMLLDLIGYNSLQGCLGGSLWDCVDLASNALGPIKALKVGRSLYKAADRAFEGYRLWKRIIDGAQTTMRRAYDAINAGRKLLNDVMKKVPKKPKLPKKKKKPAAKKKPKPKPKPKLKPKPSKQAKPEKPQTAPKKEKAPTKQAKPKKPEPTNKEPKKENRRAEEQDDVTSSNTTKQDPADLARCATQHSFDPDTRVLMADGTTRAISDVTIGDEVRATDPQTGHDGARQVTLLHANRDLDLTDVTVSDQPADTAVDSNPVNEGNGDRSTRGPTTTVLKTTAHHPFWDATTGTWVDAAELVAGESTLVGHDGQIQYVTAVRNFTGSKVMRDLTVDDIHTYYVLAGDEPVLVHNNNCGPDYGEINSDGQRNGMRVLLTKDFITNNKKKTKPSLSKPIPGYVSGQDNQTHLLGARLGGSNNDPRNFVAMHRYANSPIHRDDFEDIIYDAVMNKGQTVDYRVIPIYGGRDPRPFALMIEAIGSGPNPLIMRDVIFNEPFRR